MRGREAERQGSEEAGGSEVICRWRPTSRACPGRGTVGWSRLPRPPLCVGHARRRFSTSLVSQILHGLQQLPPTGRAERFRRQFIRVAPYQQTPFQFSLHVLPAPDAALEHHAFLARDFKNTMPALACALRTHLPAAGCIIVWNKSFEMGRNKEMAAFLPEYRSFFESVNGRVFDLMEIFRNQHYVYAGFRGSSSIEKSPPGACPQPLLQGLGDSRGRDGVPLVVSDGDVRGGEGGPGSRLQEPPRLLLPRHFGDGGDLPVSGDVVMRRCVP